MESIFLEKPEKLENPIIFQEQELQELPKLPKLPRLSRLSKLPKGENQDELVNTRCISLTLLDIRCCARGVIEIGDGFVCNLHYLYGMKLKNNTIVKPINETTNTCVGMNKNGLKCIHPKKYGNFCGIHFKK